MKVGTKSDKVQFKTFDQIKKRAGQKQVNDSFGVNSSFGPWEQSDQLNQDQQG